MKLQPSPNWVIYCCQIEWRHENMHACLKRRGKKRWVTLVDQQVMRGRPNTRSKTHCFLGDGCSHAMACGICFFSFFIPWLAICSTKHLICSINTRAIWWYIIGLYCLMVNNRWRGDVATIRTESKYLLQWVTGLQIKQSLNILKSTLYQTVRAPRGIINQTGNIIIHVENVTKEEKETKASLLNLLWFHFHISSVLFDF